MKFRTTALMAAAALTLGACAAPHPDSSAQYPGYPASGPVAYSQYGYVDTVEVAQTSRAKAPSQSQSIGIGAIGGAIAGGVLGNQIGHGTGRAAATVGGAVAGGVIGNEIEKRVANNRQPDYEAYTEYRYRIRMDDGSYQSFAQDFDAGVRAGDRVRVENARVYRL